MSSAFGERLRLEHEAYHAGRAGAHRDEALRRAVELGLPGLRDDAWRYANLRPIEKLRLAPASHGARASARDLELPPALAGFARLTFVNGCFAPELSAPLQSLAAVTLSADAIGEGGSVDWPQPQAQERFAWLNEAFAPQPARLQVRGEADLELVLLADPTPDGGASYPNLSIELAPGARVRLVEEQLGGGGTGTGMLTDSAVRIGLGANARLKHYRLQNAAADATVLDTLLARLDAQAEYQLTLVNLGALSHRSSVRVQLLGEAARLRVHGMSLADQRQVIDTLIAVEHLGRGTANEQTLRAIANGQSGIGFTSRVDVAASAAGADSRQSLKGLIGAPGAEINLRPQLEINTDEVSASHGATTGTLDQTTLFYLLSRGLDPETARKLLEWAFIEDVMSRIDLPALRRRVELATVHRLGNAAALEALL